MEFKHTQLDNSLTIAVEANPAAASMAAGFFVRTGSRDETPEVSGVSHFLEHMMFKGTARRSAADVNREFDELGANYNASTSYENTVYYGAVLNEFQDGVLDILCDVLRPALRPEDFELEKNVILEEIAMYEDIPSFRLYDKLMAEHFADHPLGNSILGTRESIGALTSEQMGTYFDRQYSPGNITVVGVGNLDFDRFVDKVSQMCSGWREFDVSRDKPPVSVAGTSGVVVDEKVTLEHIGLMLSAPSAQDDDRYAGGILATILGDSTGSRLYYALVDPAIADEASMSHDPLDEAGAFLTFITSSPARAAEALEIARNVFAKFLQEGPTDAELEAARNKIASSETLRGELPMGRLSALGRDWSYRRKYIPLSDHIQRYLSVTAEEVRQVAHKHDLSTATIMGLGQAKSL